MCESFVEGDRTGDIQAERISYCNQIDQTIECDGEWVCNSRIVKIIRRAY